MKKTLRAIIAATLAALMAFSGLTAFAAANTDTQLEWDYYGDSYYYDYAGELTEGENEIIETDSYYIYYTFYVQNAGYYTMSYSYIDADFWVEIPQKVENGIAYNAGDRLSCGENRTSINLFYLEKGEQIIGFDIYYIGEGTKFNIEYLGEDITSVETAADSLILGGDIFCYNDEIEGYWFSIHSDVNITFSSGKTITKDYFSGSTEKDIIEGENTIAIWVCGKKYNLTVNAELVTDYVESAEISNIEDYLNIKIYYDGFESYEPYGETLTVTFKDGTTGEIVLNDDEFLVLPNGSEVWCYTDFETNGNETFLNVYIAETLVKSYECTEIEANIDENIDAMNSNKSEYIYDVSYYIRRALISILQCDSIYEFIEYGSSDSAYYFRWAFEAFVSIFTEAYDLIAYYLA